MFRIDTGNRITMINGDTAYITLTVNEYQLSPGDSIRFTVKKTIKDRLPLISKEITDFNEDGTCTIILYPDDTYSLEAGSYLFDVQLTLSDGRIDTIIGPSTLNIITGITD